MEWVSGLFGQASNEKVLTMADGQTILRIVEFPPQKANGQNREHWTYVTNGMAERKMPGLTGPKVNPRMRTELMVYSSVRYEYAFELLRQLAEFPFTYNTTLGHNHTLPFSHPDLPWTGLILTEPLAEPEGSDWLKKSPVSNPEEMNVTYLVQVCGLHQTELDYAIAKGGKVFIGKTFSLVRKKKGFWSLLVFDLPREEISIPEGR
ncbi:MAG TPA: suppressor of fused domain protein [Opitutaceae bacterium]|nr:suppressor of fused domain protein [Opitutaceae bacterium]